MMDEVGEFLGRLTAVLDGAQVPYMVVGGLATIAYGRPRTTQDADVIVVLGGRDVKRLVAAFPTYEWYADEGAAVDAVRHQGQFNVIDLTTGWKADLIVRSREPFHREEFARRRRGMLGGVELWLASPEDVVIAKLDWARRSGGSERQLDDVRGILTVQATSLDRDYVQRWVRELGLEEEWQRTCR
jgi:hypothetical protein